MTPRNAAIYLRVSTDRQADADRFGLDVQARAVKRYAKQNGFEVTATFTDAVTGTLHRRDQLDTLLERASAFDAVIISSVDRLGRRNRVIYTVLDELMESGLEVHTTDTGLIDPENEMSMLTFGVRSLFAESEHRRLVQKMQHAKIAKVAGNPLTGKAGQPVTPLNRYGWKRGEIVPHERQWVIYMYQRLQTVGCMVVSRELRENGVLTRQGSVWTPTKIARLVRNPVYKGTFEYGHTARDGSPVKASCDVEAFVSVELWETANRHLRERNARTQAAKTERLKLFPLTGHVFCGVCNRRMSGHQNGRAQYGYYICNDTRIPAYLRTNDRRCTHGKSYRAEHVHEVVLGALNALEVDGDLTGMMPTYLPSVPDHTAALADLACKDTRLEAAYLAGAYTPEEYAEKRQQLRDQRTSIEAAPLPMPLHTMPEHELRERLHTALQQPLPELADLLGLKVIISPGGDITLRFDPPVVA